MSLGILKCVRLTSGVKYLPGDEEELEAVITATERAYLAQRGAIEVGPDPAPAPAPKPKKKAAPKKKKPPAPAAEEAGE